MKDFIKRYAIIIGAFVLMSSCNKAAEDIDIEDDTEEEVVLTPLAFNAEIDQTVTYKVGDTVKFNLTGNSYLLGFYSGTVGNNYEFRDTERFYEVLAKLSFESNKVPANSNNVDGLELLYSTDFNGNYDYTNVKMATWLPLTSKFSIQTELQASSSTYEPSGLVDVTDIFVDDKPVYFAWFCKTNAGSYRTQFRMQQFKLQGEVIDDSSLSSDLFAQNDFNFQWVLNPEAALAGGPTVNDTQILWTGTFNNTSGPYKDGYAISKAIELPKFNAGKDTPTILLPTWSEGVAKYEFVYKKAGTYEVVFLASNLTSGAPGEIMKTVTVTVQP